MLTRYRERSSAVTGTRTHYSTGDVSSKSTLALFESVEDVVDSEDNKNFTVERTERSGGGINGYGPAATSRRSTWANYPIDFMDSSIPVQHLYVPDQPPSGVLAAQALARTQPNRPESIPWEYITEMPTYGRLARDIYEEQYDKLTKSLRGESWRVLSRAARLNLLYQFGISPLIRDIKTLMVFQKRVDKRAEEIKRLYGERGLRRTLPLWDGSSHNVSTQTHNSTNGLLFSGPVTKVTTVKIRGHVRWRTSMSLPVSEEALRAQVADALASAVPDISTLYELMPWSWLIDYFSSLGSLIQTNRNLFTVSHGVPTIMTHTRTVATTLAYKNVTKFGSTPYTLYIDPAKFVRESKHRRLTPATLQAYLPVLTNAQTSILGSLAVIRGRKFGS